MAEIHVRQRRRKLLELLLVTLLLMAGCVALAVMQQERIALLLTGIGGALVFAGLSVYLLRRIILRATLLTINDLGFEDHSKSKALGFVSWERVENIYLFKYDGETYLVAQIHDPEGIVAKVSGHLPTKIKKKGDPEELSRLHIPTIFLEEKPKALYDMMVERVQQYRKEHSA